MYCRLCRSIRIFLGGWRNFYCNISIINYGLYIGVGFFNSSYFKCFWEYDIFFCIFLGRNVMKFFFCFIV